MAAPRRYARLADGGRAFYALVEGDRVRELPGVPFSGSDRPGDSRPLAGLTWLPPCTPRTIVCVGRNYRAHAAELGNEVPRQPLLFLKPPSALLPHRGVIRLPAVSQRVDYEGEIAVVIGRTARRVPESRALEHVFGYTCLNDVTARDLQRQDIQFTRAKGFDTFCPVGPAITAGLDHETLAILTLVNGALRQSAGALEMLFGIPALISYVTGVMTLSPGDLIATGTPAGVGPLAAGDEVTVSIEGVGDLVNRVEADANAAPQ
jgi:2-keto-4-pentenoate hydratase/2-oxohepta-3-ene-1,7-dioic acid hydratase in catechol pathway